MELTRSISMNARRSAVLAAVAAAAIFAIPTTANAAVTGAVAGDTATLTGDGADDSIVIGVTGATLSHNLTGFNSAIDFNSTDPGDQTISSAARLTINSGAGLDTVTGGPGDDIINGGADLDTLAGGDGNDRITGGPGGSDAIREQISGGNGNDVMIWNNGDGVDTNEGEAGADEVVITNGAADDQMSLAPGAPGRTLFSRANNPFSVDIGTSERINITSFAGDDSLTQAAPGVTLPIVIDAGPGADTITGGDGADLLQGGDGVDTLNGGAGGDRILGNPGNDVMNGNAGDDTLVWNNGDGTDAMNGQDGLDRIEDNLGAANDNSQVKVIGGKVFYDRLNAPFALTIDSSEVLELNTFGGDDILNVAPGVGALIAITADGGEGNDVFNGNDEADTFFGGLGNDTLSPGAGADAIDGQAGNDVLNVRDGAGDLARGGSGTDSAQADVADVLTEVESIDVPAGADVKGTAIQVRTKRIDSKLKRGVYTARVEILCPAAEAGGCKGTLALQTAKAVKIGGVKVTALVGSKSYSLNAGQTRTLSIKLPKGIRKFSKKGTLSLRAVSTSRDAAGNVATGVSKLTVRLVK
jgi:Ca2+-binding RTX toxin-like protein